jgi:hypothetical protein
MAENLGWSSDQFIEMHFDAALFFKDDTKNIYGDMMLAEYILSIHGSTAGSVQSKKRHFQQPQKLDSFIKRVLYLRNEQTFVGPVNLAEVIDKFPDISICDLSEEVKELVIRKNIPLAHASWFLSYIKAKCLLDGRLVATKADYDCIEELYNFIQENLPKGNSRKEATSNGGKKVGNAPKGKSGQMKAFVAMLDHGQILTECELKEIAENLSLDYILTNWHAMLDAFNQQGILLRASGNQYKVL